MSKVKMFLAVITLGLSGLLGGATLASAQSTEDEGNTDQVCTYQTTTWWEEGGKVTQEHTQWCTNP